MNCAPGMCQRLETCMDSNCPEHPLQPHNQWGAGRPLNTQDGGVSVNGSLSFPLHRQVMPPEPDTGDSAYWLAYGIAGAIFIAFVVMTWVVYPNFPQ